MLIYQHLIGSAEGTAATMHLLICSLRNVKSSIMLLITQFIFEIHLTSSLIWFIIILSSAERKCYNACDYQYT